jgi:hypothetical protein
MKSDPQKKLQHRQVEQETSDQQAQSQSQSNTREFGSVEEMLRYDAAHTEPPPTLKSRLLSTLSKEPESGRQNSWWRRLFGR